MSKYTVELRFICESFAGLDESVGLNDIDTVISKAIPKIFDFDFPIFNEEYRTILEEKIIRHYYMREICCETVALWKHYLRNRLVEIMPIMNKFYETELIEYSPIEDVDYTREYSNSGNTSGNSATRDKNKSAYSDTPQGSLVNIESNEYLTNATVTDNSNNSDYKTNADSNGVERVHGKMGNRNYSEMIKQYRNNIINTDVKVIESLSDLFFNLW